MKGACVIWALLLLSCASSSGSSAMSLADSTKPHVSPLKSCEPLRVVATEQVALLRGHFQKYQSLARQIKEMEHYAMAKNKTPDDPTIARALEDPRSEAQLLQDLAEARTRSDVALQGIESSLAAIKSQHHQIPSDWTKHQVSHCLANKLYPGLVPGRPRISFLMQHYKRPKSIMRVLQPLMACRPVVASELLVNVDHPATAEAWIDLAYNTSGWVVPVFSNNVHEIRAYNRLGHMAKGQVLVILQSNTIAESRLALYMNAEGTEVLLAVAARGCVALSGSQILISHAPSQDDAVISSNDCSWALDLLRVFDKYPKVGAIGNKGFVFKVATQGWGGPARFYDPELNVTMQFTSLADYAPFSVRKAAFIDIGGIDEGLSEPGECGIYTDFDVCMRMWAAGWQVAYMFIPWGNDGDEGSSHGKVTGARCWGKQIGAAGKAHAMKFPFVGPSKDDVWEQVMLLNWRHLRLVDSTKCPYEEKQCEDLHEYEQLKLQQREQDDMLSVKQAAIAADYDFADDDGEAAAQQQVKDLDRDLLEAEWRALQQQLLAAGGSASTGKA